MPELPDQLVTPEQWAYLMTRQEIRTMKEETMAEIERLRTVIVNEVTEAVTGAQGRIDAALAQAGASDEARQAAQAELEDLKGRATALADEVEAEGLFGQETAAAPEPGAEPSPEPTAPDTGETPPNPAEPDTGTTEPGTEPLPGTDTGEEGGGEAPDTTAPGTGETDPGSVTF